MSENREPDGNGNPWIKSLLVWGGIFLALGFLTRWAAFFIAFVMLVAILGVHAADPYQRKELAFMYLFVAAAFMIKGSGDWSVDSFLRK